MFGRRLFRQGFPCRGLCVITILALPMGNPPITAAPDLFGLIEMWTGRTMRPYDGLPHRRWWRTFMEYAMELWGDIVRTFFILGFFPIYQGGGFPVDFFALEKGGWIGQRNLKFLRGNLLYKRW